MWLLTPFLAMQDMRLSTLHMVCKYVVVANDSIVVVIQLTSNIEFNGVKRFPQLLRSAYFNKAYFKAFLFCFCYKIGSHKIASCTYQIIRRPNQ